MASVLVSQLDEDVTGRRPDFEDEEDEEDDEDDEDEGDAAIVAPWSLAERRVAPVPHGSGAEHFGQMSIESGPSVVHVGQVGMVAVRLCGRRGPARTKRPPPL